MEALNKCRVEKKAMRCRPTRWTFQESGDRSQQTSGRAGRGHLGRRASQELPMCLRRSAEELIGFPLAIARHPIEPGDQPVPLRHRWARPMLSGYERSFADNSDASRVVAMHDRPEANGINQKGALDKSVAREAEKKPRRMGRRTAPFTFSAWIVAVTAEPPRSPGHRIHCVCLILQKSPAIGSLNNRES